MKNLLFSEVKTILWPIHRQEISKFFLMASMMFLILLCHNSVRVLKDSIIINDFGAEAISFIKLWVEIPFGSFFVIIYYKLCNIYTTEKTFRIVISVFLGFYALFGFVIYPNQEYFHLSEQNINYFSDIFPNFKWFILILGKWSITLFYLFGEFWPAVTFSLLFWQLANKIITYDESKRFYPHFNFFGQLNLLFAGYIVCLLVNENGLLCKLFINNSSSITEVTIKSIMTFVLIMGLVILAIHKTIEKYIIPSISNLDNKKLLRLGIVESFILVIKSHVLTRIAILIITYHICVNVIEGIWFAKVYQLYTTSDKFIDYQGRVLFYTGVCGILSSLLGGFLLRKYTWFFTAVLTPIVLLIFGGGFLLIAAMEESLNILLAGTGISALGVITFLGGFQNAIGKGIKYGIFDVTKEMLYIPLDNESKAKGKAAVDVLGTKIGKALGSCSQFCIFTLLPHTKIDDIVFILLFIYVISALVWIINTKKLAKIV